MKFFKIITDADWKSIGMVVLIAMGAFAIGYTKGDASARIDIAETEKTAIVKEVRREEKTRKKVARYNDDELDRRWCDSVLDMPRDECLARNKSVRVRRGHRGDEAADRHP